MSLLHLKKQWLHRLDYASSLTASDPALADGLAAYAQKQITIIDDRYKSAQQQWETLIDNREQVVAARLVGPPPHAADSVPDGSATASATRLTPDPPTSAPQAPNISVISIPNGAPALLPIRALATTSATIAPDPLPPLHTLVAAVPPPTSDNVVINRDQNEVDVPPGVVLQPRIPKQDSALDEEARLAGRLLNRPNENGGASDLDELSESEIDDDDDYTSQMGSDGESDGSD